MDQIFRLKIVNVPEEECKSLKEGDKFPYLKKWWIAEKMEIEPDGEYVTVYCTETDGENIWAEPEKKVTKSVKKSTKKTTKGAKK